MNFDDFISKYDGKKVDIDGVYGNQCKDLFSAYNTEVVENPTYVWGNAKDLYDNAPNEFYTKILNTNDFVPRKGDVVIWNMKPYGHVGIFVDGDVNSFRSFDQNYKGNLEPCQIVSHNYKNVVGFLRPKKEEQVVQQGFSEEHMKGVIRATLEYAHPQIKGSVVNLDNDVNYRFSMIQQGNLDPIANQLSDYFRDQTKWVLTEKYLEEIKKRDAEIKDKEDLLIGYREIISKSETELNELKSEIKEISMEKKISLKSSSSIELIKELVGRLFGK